MIPCLHVVVVELRPRIVTCFFASVCLHIIDQDTAVPREENKAVVPYLA